VLGLHRSKLTRYRKRRALALRGHILDCGGGLGDYLPYLHGSVVILDKELQILRGLSHQRRLVGDAEVLPFRDNSFDHVWACAIAQYVHLDKFVSEARRVTRSGGHILVLVPNGKSPWDRLKKVLGMATWWDQKGILTHYTVDDLRRYGKVLGEIQFLPLERLFRNAPRMGHTLMLDIVVGG
jgi:ubiquinone/menaquinone biosynthesis C-methylase UbiE